MVALLMMAKIIDLCLMKNCRHKIKKKKTKEK